MTPNDVATNKSLLLRFQSEVAYLDRMRPSQSEERHDTELLGSKDGVLVIAWLWPSAIYGPNFDPFDAASAEKQVLCESAVGASPLGSAEEGVTTADRAVDDPRAERRRVVGRRFVKIIESAARAVNCSEEDLMTHIKWSTPLTQMELDELRHGSTSFPFSVIIDLCHALELEFSDAWILADRQRLADRIIQSVTASGISNHLHKLTLDQLQQVLKKLPLEAVRTEDTKKPEVYRAPQTHGRYWSLYEALAADERDCPDYTLANIDQILQDAGEGGLPASAWETDGSWWAGTGARAEGRPQIRAWWGAGYRVRDVGIDDEIAGNPSIGFEALPGRSKWLARAERTARRMYQIPGPVKLQIYPDFIDTAAPRTANDSLAGIKAALALLAQYAQRIERENVPDDPDIRHLTEFLDEVGEADRSQIEVRLSKSTETPVDEARMTNLLTKARRQGWTVNKGSRSRPRWAATRKRVMLMGDIADKCNLEAPLIESTDPVPVDFLRLVANSIEAQYTTNSAPQIAREIVESRGRTWQPAFESADESITSLGLEAINEAIGTSWVWRPEWDQL